jgi:hypothetical protein
VTLTAGHRYTFSASANVSTSDTLDSVFIRLRDSAGAVLSPDKFAEGATPSFVFDVPGSGDQTYYLAVSAGGSGAWWDKIGDFTVSLTSNGVGTPVNYTPTAQGHDKSDAPGTQIPLTDLFTYGDLNGPSDIVSFAVQDRTPDNGYLTWNDVPQAPNQVYERPISEPKPSILQS